MMPWYKSIIGLSTVPVDLSVLERFGKHLNSVAIICASRFYIRLFAQVRDRGISCSKICVSLKAEAYRMRAILVGGKATYTYHSDDMRFCHFVIKTYEETSSA